MIIKGIDISHWNGDIDFNKVKAAGIEFVIIKAGGSDRGFYTDSKFRENYEKAKAAGLFVGAYYFVGKNFYGDLSGIEDAKRFIKILQGMQFEYPVYLDVETTDARYKELATDAAIAFCSTMEAAGYYVGIYASDISGFKEKLNHSRLQNYAHWVARYGKDPEVCKEGFIHQYSSKGAVDGIVGSVDLDKTSCDYSKYIIAGGFNGFKKTSTGKVSGKSEETKKKKIKSEVK